MIAIAIWEQLVTLVPALVAIPSDVGVLEEGDQAPLSPTPLTMEGLDPSVQPQAGGHPSSVACSIGMFVERSSICLVFGHGAPSEEQEGIPFTEGVM
ncbi:UNVERIFIED_CONTAM: hypothetical protein Slati_0144000 [Sesamum latifolium]|uniref:Secreted protein n=1 Tax=Sesamum latifolium TaxID=2727402 RepID=A0AAW2Y9U4_9LAMI